MILSPPPPVLVTKPRALHLLVKSSTTELNPHPMSFLYILIKPPSLISCLYDCGWGLITEMKATYQ